jgi:long-chain acyl-CoA synthetase
VPLAQAHRPLPLALRLQRVLADWLVFRQVRAALGGRLELAITGAAPMDLNVLTFFHAAGVRLLEGWGLTETGGAITVNRARDYRLGTVGQLFPGHELRIADDGEILLRGPCVATGYYQKPEATSEAFDAEGWFHTGDIGTLDAGGFLRISDRKKDLIATAAGKKVAPQYLENLLRRIPGVAQAAVFGDRMPYLVALLTLDAQQVRAWAAGAGADPDTRTIGEIGASPAFRSYLDAQIAQLNAQLASYETIKRYHVLVDQEFSTANDLLTPTEKIRRRQIAARYREEIAQLYAPTGHAARGA